MADTPETLFFFEVFVDYVRLDAASARKVDEGQPAVGVRFLDFPTLLIYPSENHDPSSKPPSSDILQPGEESAAVYCFRKGKSCLFKTSLESLHTHLSNTPVYTMLLDVGGEDIPKLIGSSLVSLAKLTASIKGDVEKRGIWVPAAYGESKIGSLLNLMGGKIGTIYFACKLVSLGTGLIPHISEPKLELSRPVCSEKMNVATSAVVEEENLKNDILIDEFQPPHPESCRVTSTEVQRILRTNGNPILFETSETNRPHGSSACTQTKKHKQKYTALVGEKVKCGGDQQLCSTFCPPSLFYSSSATDQHQLTAERDRMVNATAEGLQMMDLKTTDSDDESCGLEYDHQIKEEPRRNEEAGLLNTSNTVKTLISQTDSSVLWDAVRQLPLLSTLLLELSHLNGQVQLQQPPQSSSSSPSVQTDLLHRLAMCMSAQEEGSPGFTSGMPCPQCSHINKTKVLQSAFSSLPKDPLQPHGNPCVPSKSHISSFISTSKQPASTKSQQETSYQKQKLRYGLTHSFRLRLKQIKPGLTRHHECMEQHFETKQVEPQTKPPVRFKQQGHNMSASQSFCRGLEDIRCGEMVKMVETDCVVPEARSSRLPQNKSSLESSMEKDVHSKSDSVSKVWPVQVHSALGLHFDQSTQDDGINPPYLVENRTDLRSSTGSSVGNDAEPYRPSHRSDSSSDSSQEKPCKYQDDFTSLDPTDGSPNPLSSPEPSRLQKTHRFSSSGSSSSGSFVHRNRAHPVPVKTQTSPKRSLKGTRLMKLQKSIHSDPTSSSSLDNGQSRTSMRPQRSSESYSSFPESLKVSRNFESPHIDHAIESALMKEQCVDKFQTSDDFMLESVSSTDPEEEEERDKLDSLGFKNKYLPISELMVNQLPGYTL